jgi:uncharacterized tellurite resistance protein B-like protein
MTTPQKNVQILIKILIGAAWLDGKLQPEEQDYLRRIATAKGVSSDPEIYTLLNSLKAVTPDDCYKWVREYLGSQPQIETCYELIEAVSGLIYSDGNVAIEEAKLLQEIQAMDQTICAESTLIKTVNQLYRRWLAIVRVDYPH